MENKKLYTYYFRLRPPSIGTHPTGNITISNDTVTLNNRTYHGTVTYDRELTEKELCNYDLDSEPKTLVQLKELYKDFLIDMFNGNMQEVGQYIDSEDGYNEFINNIL